QISVNGSLDELPFRNDFWVIFYNKDIFDAAGVSYPTNDMTFVQYSSLPFTAERTLSTPRHYAYLKIAEGCNRHCSYCAIPLIRGRHVSRPIDELVDEARNLVASGVKEIIIIAQDTTYYGLDLYGRRRLGDLLNRLATESGAPWIRLHYTYPTDFPLDAIQAMRQHSNICNYIDIPLQHINSRLLHSMQRGIDRGQTLALLDRFRQQLPDVSIRTTLIVGYPGESEAEFEELKQFVADARFDRMGCFAYSPEEGTPAESLGDPVPEEEKQRRVDELMALQQSISLQKNLSRVGRQYQVLVDRREGDYYVARTEYDSPDIDDEVLIPATRQLPVGSFQQVVVTQAMEHDLMAKLL
ncbi:MAG: 30S ribosomal protein S12 methylthiotransferase RimO, partial [Bacteroidales bacterium]|nr:30S ribosomal protein S12 methylthiotransferase RimO [Bacteroidales bacterium]